MTLSDSKTFDAFVPGAACIGLGLFSLIETCFDCVVDGGVYHRWSFQLLCQYSCH